MPQIILRVRQGTGSCLCCAEETAFRNFERKKQVVEAFEWLCGKKFPAVCAGHPDRIILTKRKGNAITVGLRDFFADKIYDAKYELPEDIASFRIFGAEGKADKNILTVSEIDAYGFAAVEVCCEKNNRKKRPFAGCNQNRRLIYILWYIFLRFSV